MRDVGESVGFSAVPHETIILLVCPQTSEEITKSPLSPLLHSLSLTFFLSVLLPPWLEISFCQRNHSSLSQSNYKAGYFLLLAKHIADWYCMTSFSHLFYSKITVKSTLALQWNCLGDHSDIFSEAKLVGCNLKWSVLTCGVLKRVTWWWRGRNEQDSNDLICIHVTILTAHIEVIVTFLLTLFLQRYVWNGYSL